jgi:hypothetical protein
VKKVALLVAGVGAALTMGVVGAGHAVADVPDVTGETFNSAKAILQAQGIQATFGGSVGGDLPQSQCIVIEQTGQGSSIWSRTPGSTGVMRLRLDCTLKAGQAKPDAPGTFSVVPPGGSVPGGGQEGARPTPGAGTVTVTARPVG